MSLWHSPNPHVSYTLTQPTRLSYTHPTHTHQHTLPNIHPQHDILRSIDVRNGERKSITPNAVLSQPLAAYLGYALSVVQSNEGRHDSVA